MRCRTPTTHLHQGARRGHAYDKRTALPGVGCRRLLGARPGTDSHLASPMSPRRLRRVFDKSTPTPVFLYFCLFLRESLFV